MHLFGVAFIISGILFALFHQQKLILYFSMVIACYLVLSIVLPKSKNIPNRKKIMVATWNNPSEGVIHLKVPCRVEKVEEMIKNYTGNDKLTITHFVIKGASRLLAYSDDLRGKLVFGKVRYGYIQFVPHNTVDISCLVDIENGKDLAMLLVEEVDKKSVKQVASFLKMKGSEIKKSKGDRQHKQRTKLADYFPAFFVAFAIQFARFVTNRLGLSIPALALKRHQFGSGCVTSIGMLNFCDASAPFCPFMDCTFFVSANAVHEAPVIQNGKIAIGRIINCNFVVDHRYIDGGKAKNFIRIFTDVFNYPELFIDNCGPVQPIQKEMEKIQQINQQEKKIN